MGGVVKSVTSLATRSSLDVLTGGLAEIGGRSKAVGDRVGNMVVGNNGQGYTPQMLSAQDPKLLLAQTGGAPLLTQIALGASVDDALAGYFGRKSGNDYKAWYDSLNPNEQAALDGVKNQLTAIQKNTDLRNAAVQQVVADYPNVVAQIAPRVQAAKQAAGQEFDQASQAYLDYALKQVGAKYAAGGNLSSGAMAQASADEAAKLGLQKLDYTTNRGDVAYNNASNELLGGWQARYTEANALRNFQQAMLGQGVQQGFSANQSMLERNQGAAQFNSNQAFQKAQLDQQNQNAMFGALGSLAGSALGGFSMGRGMASYSMSNAMAAPSPTPRLQTAGVNGYRGVGY